MKPADYDRIATAWDDHRREFRPREREYFEWLVRELPPSADVLDLGCGTGLPNARFIKDAGHRVTGIDLSGELLAIAATNLPGAELRQGRIEDAEFGGPHDAVICWDALFHIGRDHHEPILRRVAACLATGGLLLLTSGGSENPPFTDTMFGSEFPYDAPAPDRTIDIIRGAGFTLVRQQLIDPPTGGRDKGRLVVAARRT